MSSMDPNVLRALFSKRLSNMYKDEVALYGDLVQLVQDVNAKSPLLQEMSAAEQKRLDQERHGAIRVGRAKELRDLSRLFALMGMKAVGYYDLSVAGHPVHGTAFRSTDAASLLKNPFRIFCSMLRFDMITNKAIADKSREILTNRHVFPDRLMELVEKAERAGGVAPENVDEMLDLALETFKFDRQSLVPEPVYQEMCKESKLIADIVCFSNHHFNHLTPCTLDIDQVQDLMISRGIPPKSIIEGPPARLVPILLRQTSFKALEEKANFPPSDPNGSPNVGYHSARFGEIETRGAALTLAGRRLFDEIFQNARSGNTELLSTSPGHMELVGNRAKTNSAGETTNDVHQRHLEAYFQRFPDNLQEMWERELCYVQYLVKEGAAATLDNDLKTQLASMSRHEAIRELVAQGIVTYKYIIYEDFLPASAAGIFTSNLTTELSMDSISQGVPAQNLFEQELGHPVNDPHELYEAMENESIEKIFELLGI